MSDDNWIPEPLRDAPFFKGGEDGTVKTAEQVMADLTNAAQHMGNSIRIPSADEGDEAMQSFVMRASEKIPGLMPVPKEGDDEVMSTVWANLGRPNDADGYQVPEGIEVSKEAKDAAFAMNMTQSQFQAMVTNNNAQAQSQMQAQQEAAEAAMAELKTEWGAAFDQRSEKVAGLLKNSEAPEYLMSALAEGKLPAGDLKWLYAVADSLGSEGAELTHHQGGEAILSPDLALAELSGLENREDKAMWTPSHPDYQRLNKRRLELMKLAYPDSQESIDAMRA